MKKTSKQILFITIFLGGFLLGQNVQAACTGASPMWTAASPAYTDVNDCVAAATAGDTVNVPAGTGSITWPASAVTISNTKPLKIIGPGASNLTINLGGSYVFTILPYIGTTQLPATRISGFKFVSPLDAKYAAVWAQGQGWRIDHCAYESIESANSITAGMIVYANGLNTSIQPYGLIDNNDIKNGKVDVGGPSNFTNMSAAWSDALDLGGPTAVYVEDNYFYTSIENNANKRLAVDANYGGKYVFRYNTGEQIDTMAHGLQSNDSRATRKWELYGNTLKKMASGADSPFNPKAGTGVIFNNDMTSAGYNWNTGIVLQHERDDSTEGVGICGDGSAGSLHYDGNKSPDSTYHGWLCRDQLASGQDAFTWQDQPMNNPAPAQTILPAYFWSNVDNTAGSSSNGYQIRGNGGLHIHADRDFFNYTSSFNGTSGMGCGTLANRPATCAYDSVTGTGVGYWATNQSCTDMTGMVGANPTTPISGTLYRCTATNTWTAYYTPYTYPHPLRNESVFDTTPPAPPTGLTVN